MEIERERQQNKQHQATDDSMRTIYITEKKYELNNNRWMDDFFFSVAGIIIRMVIIKMIILYKSL